MNYLLIFLGGLVFWVIFNLLFLWFYNDHIHWDIVLKWFREKGLIGMLSTEDSKYIYYIEDSIERACFSKQKYDSYEIARKELVKELIEIFANVSNNL